MAPWVSTDTPFAMRLQTQGEREHTLDLLHLQEVQKVQKVQEVQEVQKV